jgi:iron complex transport system ATP-binding protein
VIRADDDGIRVRDVNLLYDGVIVLDEVTLNLKRGSVTTLLGPNGCGKTTLLKVINGLLKPNGGVVSVEGRDVAIMNPKELAKTIGIVSQIHRTSFPFSVLDVVLTGRMPYISAFSMPGEEDLEIAGQSLARVGMGHLSMRPYTQISGGERQLTMIARALAQEPRFLILDEPTSYLDFKNQVMVLKMVTELARKGDFTVVMTLHDPNHALMFSDEVVLMRKLASGVDGNGGGLLLREDEPSRGNVVAFGRPAEVMTPEKIAEAYGIKVEILEHNGRRILLPL